MAEEYTQAVNQLKISQKTHNLTELHSAIARIRKLKCFLDFLKEESDLKMIERNVELKFFIDLKNKNEILEIEILI